MLSVDSLKQVVPAEQRQRVTQDLVDQLNNVASDPLHAETIKENFVSYSSVLNSGRYKMEDYLNAVTYVSYKVMGYSNQDSYFRTFPTRHSSLVARGATAKDISSYVAAYNKNKLVNLILEQSLIPVYILNQDAVQKAINTQIEIMSDHTYSAVARTQAANSLLTHLATPREAAELNINIETPESTGLKNISAAISDLARQQKKMIELGVTAKEIAETDIMEGEIVDD